MGVKALRVELFFTVGCSHCAKAREELRQAAESAGNIDWREVDIVKHPHRAVDAGVVSTPAIAIDGTLVFKTTPTPAELRSAIRARAGKA